MTWVPETLFRKIITVVPIACVDSVVNRERNILMVKRKNEPATGDGGFLVAGSPILKTRFDAAE